MFKLNSAKSKEVDFEFVGRGFLKEGNPFLKAPFCSVY